MLIYNIRPHSIPGTGVMITNDKILCLWGKADRKDPSISHPLLFHMIDTMNVVEVMWNRVLSNHTKLLISKSFDLTPVQTKSLVLFLSGLHDLGKATPGFQGLVDGLQDKLKKHGYETGSYDIHHGKLSAYLFMNECPFTNIDYAHRLPIAFSIGVHHGNMISANDLEQVYSTHVGTGIWEKSRKKMMGILMDFCHIERSIQWGIETELPGALFALLSGLISVCDWIASAEANFPYLSYESNIDAYRKISETQAEAAIDSLHWDIPTTISKESSFTDLFPFIVSPNTLQVATSEISKELNEPSLTIIEAPMGMGKTEAALYLQDRFSTIGISGLYIGLPTQATANQMFQRVVEFLKNQESEVFTNLHLLHGKAMFSDEYQLLKSGNNSHYDNEGVIADEWFTYRKRGLLSPYGVGTIDQALMSVIPTKHFFVRLFGLAGKTVILDEVHAYDVYMSTLLDRMISWLHAIGSSIVVLSATLTSHRRRELLNAYSIIDSNGIDCPYPRISWISGSHSGVTEVPTVEEKRFALKWICENDILTTILASLSNGGCMAIICNTVRRSQDIYQWLASELIDRDIEIDLFHARFPFGDRKRKENSCLKTFGKGERNTQKKTILVATQVIEQSLDLDFDNMITELAPVDLVLQRMGRLHRHARDRPAGLNEPTLYLLGPTSNRDGSMDFGPSKYVYAEYILLRTYLALRNRNSLTLPADIETLVEWVYCAETAEAEEVIHLQLQKAKELLDFEIQRLNKLARHTIIMKPSEKKPWEYINEMLVEDNPEVHQTLMARTRDIGPSLAVICLYETEKGLSLDCFGDSIIQLDTAPETKHDFEKYLNQSVTIAHRGIIGFLLENCEIPNSWKCSSLLRYSRPLIFKQSQTINRSGARYEYSCGNYTIILNSDLGIIYTKVAK